MLIYRIIFLVMAVGGVHQAQAATYTREGDVVGAIEQYTVKKGDSLYPIARHYDIGIMELQSANTGIDPWKLKIGTVLTMTTSHVLPAHQEGIVINTTELRLFYFVDATTVMTFPIGIGREGWLTPLGSTTIIKKRRNPVWIAPASILADSPKTPARIAAGPDNPLGAYAMNLGWVNYAIHGTNHPYTVGTRSSHGCIRLYPKDIETLFNAVSKGTSVTVSDEPFKLGWRGETLLLEVIPAHAQTDATNARRNSIPQIHAAIEAIARDIANIDWGMVDQTISKHDGIPMVIGTKK